MPPSLARLLQDALAHHQANRFAQANALYAQALRIAPGNFDALHLAGTLALQQNRPAEALPLLTRARRADPKSAICALRLGVALQALDRLQEAETQLRASLALVPKAPDAWMHLGIVLERQNRPADAIAALQKAIELNPRHSEAMEQLGTLLTATQGAAAAEPIFRKLVSLQPNRASAWSNLGITLGNIGELGEALTCFERALALEPRLAHAHAGQGLTLERCYRLPEALAAYSRAIDCNPSQYDAQSARLLGLHYLPDIPREQLFAEHVQTGQRMAATLPKSCLSAQVPARPATRTRLRLIILSADLRAHSVAYFLEPLLAHLDRTAFEVILYHDHAKVDAMTERLRSLADEWRYIAAAPHHAVAALLRNDAPDILLDLAGHTGLNRIALFSQRFAPVQVTYLGYPDTTGMPAMDYRLTDPFADPPGDSDAFNTETLVRFPATAWCYAPPLSAPAPAAPPSASFGNITFGCFNNFAKITDELLAIWARLLAAVPHSRLLLKGHGLEVPALRADIHRRFAQAGLDSNRVELLGRTSTIAEHLATYARIDVALDTFPYHGTTTTCEALWMGVPVVTRAGDRHASRVGISLLQAARHPDWIAHDWDAYIALAVQLANDLPLRTLLRQRLRDDLRQSALLDHPAQAARFAAALQSMWAEKNTRATPTQHS
ncbi:MAG: tetratricopeptide repeat protein [Opitutaceae bacterium]|nr:tetratricopeptide repeat protein [Opitutaceae bacterium]MBP8961461.1 tetratricopeptide repeat protein [Opitutaceae bacterium]